LLLSGASLPPFSSGSSPAVLFAAFCSVDEFSRFLLPGLDRPVINKTGITGMFNFPLEYAPDDSLRRQSPKRSVLLLATVSRGHHYQAREANREVGR
jgi:uncharacterized protein (TIGR03435 family)